MQYCEVELSEEKYQAFMYSVKNHYWYQMYIDDLPIWGKWQIEEITIVAKQTSSVQCILVSVSASSVALV